MADHVADAADHVRIFDTTLRDGEQSPGASMNLAEKLEMARALAGLGVDVIEAGFPIASNGDFEAVRAIAAEIAGSTICALARCNDRDIDRAWEAIRHAQSPRIHVFLATSAIHREHKLRMTKEQIIARAVQGVERARALCADIEFSPEDAARTEVDFLCEVVEAAIAAGATTVNIPDTVGYTTPSQYAKVFRTLRERPCCPRTATTTWGWRSPTAWRRLRPGRDRSNARSTGSANGPAMRRSRRSSWP
jgi:2-isopropylmalate synthase